MDNLALIYVLAASLLLGGSAAGQTRETAVEAARRGEYNAAIASLEALAQAAPADTGVRFDLAVVLQWAGRSGEAIAVFERYGRHRGAGIRAQRNDAGLPGPAALGGCGPARG